MNCTNSSTRKHSDGEFHKHGQVNYNSITLFNTNIFQVICKLCSKDPIKSASALTHKTKIKSINQ